MNSYKKLLSNTFIFAIGNMGSKLINILLVPLYTHHMTTSDYGTVDFLMNTAQLLLPIISLSIFEASMRFAMNKTEDPKKVLTNSLFIVLVAIIGLLLFLPLLEFTNIEKRLLIYLVLIVSSQMIHAIFAQFIRGSGQVLLFTINGIVMSLTLLVSNYFFLVKLSLGIRGYIYSLVLAYISSALVLFIFGRLHLFIEKRIDYELLKKMLVYSIPLIPNSLMWWIMNISDRYIILVFLGVSANGIYAVANKIPALLNVIHSIFFQAWQLSAIEEYNTEQKASFYSQVFSLFSTVMFVSTSGLLVVVKVIMKNFVASAYYTAWAYTPFLLLGIVFSSFSAFLGTTYIASEKTNGLFKTSVLGAVINVLVTILLIPIMGLNGASIATMLSFFVIWIFRVLDTRKIIHLKINTLNLFLSLVVISLQIGILYGSLKNEFLYNIFLSLLVLVINGRNLRKMLHPLLIKAKKSKKGQN